MMHYIRLCLIFSFAFFAMASANTFDYAVSPPIIELNVSPGKTKNVTVTVFNRRAEILNLRLKSAMLGMDVDGNAVVEEKGSDKYSCLSWLTLPADEISIPPLSSQSVPIQIRVPFGLTGGGYGIVLFQTSKPMDGQSDVLLKAQMGTIFMIRVFGSKQIIGDIESLAIGKENHGMKFTTMILNTGNIDFKVSGSILIRNQDQRIIDRVNLDTKTGTILPEHRRRFSAVWQNRQKIQKGKYVATLMLKIPGMGKMLQMDQEFTIE